MNHAEILPWLRESDSARLADLWRLADDARQRHVGGEVHLGGLVEMSNHCVRLCAYCGLRAPNQAVSRYRMTEEEIMASVGQAVGFGYGSVVLESGEDPGIEAGWMAGLLRRIKRETPLTVTLSLGERSDEELALWRDAGAGGYLLRLETSNRELYERFHPPRPGETRDRLTILRRLRELGYAVGSGVMIGVPGQTYGDLARDVALFAELELDMVASGPYQVHPNTPLGDPESRPVVPDGGQVPANELMGYKVMALSRLVCPGASIPSTVVAAVPNGGGGPELGLVRGANLMLPNLTPPKYRVHYEVYPNRACLVATPEGSHACIHAGTEEPDRPATGGEKEPRTG